VDPIDVERLERVRQWGMIPPPERTDEWVREFEAAFWPSLVVAPAERIVQGDRDKRLYRVATIYEPEAQSSLPSMETRPKRAAALVDELILKGHGLVLFTEGGEMQLCVFTIGEIVSYRLYGRAFTLALPAPEGPMRLEKGVQVGINDLTEANFPNWARINVRRHLQECLGNAQPRATWAIFPDGRSGVVFDFEAARLADEALLARTLAELRWFMPLRIPFFRIDALVASVPTKPF
jgi:hypothetical protein